MFFRSKTSKEILRRDGVLLIESIVALGIATVGILGVLSLLSRSLGVSKDVNQKFIGTYLASEGIEVVKSLIDANYAAGNAWNNGIVNGDYEVNFLSNALVPWGNTRLNFDAGTGAYSYGEGSPTPFKRKITIEGNDLNGGGDDKIKVVSTVTWPIKGGEAVVSLEDHFFDWR